MKKFLFAALAAMLLVSCGNPADNYISKINSATEKMKSAKSAEEATKISADLLQYYNDNKEAIDKALAEDTEKSQAVLQASAELASATTQAMSAGE